MFNSATLLSKLEQKEIADAVALAEGRTSGEIRVYIESSCKGDVMDRAAFLFGKLEMHKTESRNGVLIYLASADKKFAILGDAGINSKTGENFWDEIKIEMEVHFRKKEFALGLANGIAKIGESLKQHFPFTKADENELPNDIVFGK